MRRPKVKAGLAGVGIVAAVTLALVFGGGGKGPPPVEAKPVVEIDGAATWIGGNLCPPGITQEACKAVLDR